MGHGRRPVVATRLRDGAANEDKRHSNGLLGLQGQDVTNIEQRDRHAGATIRAWHMTFAASIAPPASPL
jgi:hypothetical protein